MDKPCIPFLGIYLNDIEHIQANASLINSKFTQKRVITGSQDHHPHLQTPSSPRPSQPASESGSCQSQAFTNLSSKSSENFNSYKFKQSDNNFHRLSPNYKAGPPTHLAKIRILIATLQGSDYLHITPNTAVQEFLLSFSYVEELRKKLEDAVYECSECVEPSENHQASTQALSNSNAPPVSRNVNHNRASSALIGLANGAALTR